MSPNSQQVFTVHFLLPRAKANGLRAVLSTTGNQMFTPFVRTLDCLGGGQLSKDFFTPFRLGSFPPIIIDTTVKNNVAIGNCQEFIAECLHESLSGKV